MIYCLQTVTVLAFSSVGAVAAGAIYGKKKRDAVKFQQLSQMQTQGVLLDDDEEDNENHGMVSERVRADISHI